MENRTVLFIEPRAAQNAFSFWQRVMPLLGPIYLATLAKQAGYHAVVLNENVLGRDIRDEELAEADQLKDHLLLIHSGMDENVQPQNTFQLLTALVEAGKDADFRFYPPGEHGAAFDYPSYVTMYEVYTNELCRFIGESCTPVNLNN